MGERGLIAVVGDDEAGDLDLVALEVLCEANAVLDAAIRHTIVPHLRGQAASGGPPSPGRGGGAGCEGGGVYQGVGEAEDLAFVARVGQILRIPDHAGVEDGLPRLACGHMEEFSGTPWCESSLKTGLETPLQEEL